MIDTEKVEEFLQSRDVMAWSCERMNEKRAPVKANKFDNEGSKKGRPKKRWKDMLIRRLKKKLMDRTILYKGLAAKTISPLLVRKTSRVPRG